MSKTTAWIILVAIILLLLIGGYFLFFQENEEESTNTNATVNGNVNTAINANKSTNQDTSLQLVKAFLMENPADTNNWQKYESAELGFMVEYPENYFLRLEQLSGTNAGIQLVDDQYRNSEVSFPNVTVSVYTLGEGQSLDSWITDQLSVSGYASKIEKIVTNNGLEGKLYATSSISDAVLFNSDDKIIYFSFSYFFNDETRWQVGNGMINTFSFIN